MTYKECFVCGVACSLQDVTREVDEDVDAAELLEEHDDEARPESSPISLNGEQLIYTLPVPDCTGFLSPLLFLAKSIMHKNHVAGC